MALALVGPSLRIAERPLQTLGRVGRRFKV